MNATVPPETRELYPKCNGGPTPGDLETSGTAAIKREFLRCYFIINQAAAALRRARAEEMGAEEERAALQAVERALVARDVLEDKYASIGVAATPEFENGVVVNVNFLHAGELIAGSSLSMVFAVPPPGQSL